MDDLKFYDKIIDFYFVQFAPTVAEIDDKIDTFLVDLPENKELQTLDGVTEYSQKELMEIGYKLTFEDEKKVMGCMEAQLALRVGVQLTKINDRGYRIDLEKRF